MMKENEKDFIEQYRAVWQRHGATVPLPEGWDAGRCHRRQVHTQRNTQTRLTAACLMMAALIVVLPLVPIHRSTVIANGVSRGEVLDYADQLIALL